MWEKIREKKENIDIYGPQRFSDVVLLASYIFVCVIYVVLLIACAVWAISIPIIAAFNHSLLHLAWWIPCFFVGSILIAVGAFVATKLDII